MKKRPKILYISRKNPPEVGGMEVHSAALKEALSLQTFFIGLGRRQIHLLWWLPIMLMKSLWFGHQADVVYLQDALLMPFWRLIDPLVQKPVVVLTHGLDVIWPHAWYKKLVGRTLQTADHVIAVSEATRTEVLKAGVEETRTTVVPNGIHTHGRKSDRSGGILIVGRMVERKGPVWFIRNVVPHLATSIPIDVVGGGQLLDEAREAAAIFPNVTVHGRIKEEALDVLRSKASVYVMPNQQVEGNIEGFGITITEAGTWGIPVVASDIEGIRDALADSAGLLVPPDHAMAFVDAIHEVRSWPEEKCSKIKNQTEHSFCWRHIAKQYEQIFYSVARVR